VLSREGFLYEDSLPLDKCGGGPSQQQKDAATQQAALAQQEAASAQNATSIQNKAYSQISPFATQLITKGSPYFGAQMDYAGSNAATSAAPGRAQLARSLSTQGSLPSGFATKAMADYNEGEGQSYDQNLATNENNNLNYQLQGANILNGQQTTFNPNQYYQSANSANSSIMNAPLQTTSPWSAVGGAIGAIGSAAINKNWGSNQNTN
jgi:hypothetical protein